jgi:hypothetical protein
MSPKEPSLNEKLSDPAYKFVMTKGRHLGPISNELADEVDKAFGRKTFEEVSRDLLDIDTEKKIATIKAEVRKLWFCVATIGPPQRSGNSSTTA